MRWYNGEHPPRAFKGKISILLLTTLPIQDLLLFGGLKIELDHHLFYFLFLLTRASCS